MKTKTRSENQTNLRTPKLDCVDVQVGCSKLAFLKAANWSNCIVPSFTIRHLLGFPGHCTSPTSFASRSRRSHLSHSKSPCCWLGTIGSWKKSIGEQFFVDQRYPQFSTRTSQVQDLSGMDWLQSKTSTLVTSMKQGVTTWPQDPMSGKCKNIICHKPQRSFALKSPVFNCRINNWLARKAWGKAWESVARQR